MVIHLSVHFIFQSFNFFKFKNIVFILIKKLLVKTTLKKINYCCPFLNFEFHIP